MKRDLTYVPKGMQTWHVNAVDLDVSEVIGLYRQGFAGAIYDPEGREELLASMAEPDGEAVAIKYGLAGTGEGKLSIPYLYAYENWPRMWPCPGQTTGDCVSHAGKNTALVLIGVEVMLAKPDEVTGIIEGFPVVTAQAEQQGVVACENIYGYRGHSGQGASCSTLIKYCTQVGGIMLRQPYPDLNLDFTNYNASIGIRWGGRGPPEAVNAEGKKHQLRNATDCPNHEVVRDFVANGYPIWACSGLGWSSQRDENGYSPKRGGWAHSWIVMGYDDRAEIKTKYGGPLFLFCHDWGKWNTGGRRILGTTVDIPEGTFWGDAKLLNQCDCTALSNINGWPRRDLPDWGTFIFG